MSNFDFGKLVECYERISSTTKRLEIHDILTNMFLNLKKNVIDSKELEKIIYLTQGTLYPEIKEQPKLGLADRNLLEFLSQYYTVDIRTANSILKKKGDIGDTAEEFAKMRKGKSGQITSFMGVEDEILNISDIYDKLAEMGNISGVKSIEKKFSKLKWLLARCTPSMVKYLMRIITSTLRMGVSDPSIMDALGAAYLGNKSYRELIENAYNIYPDLGYIARTIFEKGLEGLNTITIQVGMPIRMMLASRMQYTQIMPKLGGKECISEFKLDGERLQVHKDGEIIKIYSRRLKVITDQYPDVQKSIIENVKVDRCIIEGEAVAMDPFFEKMLPFQVVITRKRKYDIKEMVDKVPVCLFVFDILYLERNGKKEKAMDYPLLERRKILQQIVKSSERIKLVEGKMIHSTDELVEYFKYARSINCEGLMNKSVDPQNSMYKAGNRGFLWIKLKSLEAGKMTDSIDVVAIGALWGKGKRASQYGTLLVAVYNEENGKFELLTRVASGFSDDDLDRFMKLFESSRSEYCPENVISSEVPDVWFRPSIVMEIAGDELTISPKADAGKYYNGQVNETGYSVRFPTFQRIRDDKDIYDITKIDEIIELYEIQGTIDQTNP
jgi:DNA ligase-1